jgi:hypothetical protein
MKKAAEKNIYETLLNRKFDMTYKENKSLIIHYILKQKYNVSR